MADLTVNFMHPTDGRVISVTVEDSMTGQEAIAELIANEFIPANPQGYKLSLKGENARDLNNDKSLLENAVPNNSTIRVQPATDAGGDLTVNFMHPTDGRVISVTVEDSMTGQEAIAELIANEFIPANPQGYKLSLKGENARDLNNDKSLLENAVPNNSTIRVQPATDAGFCSN